MFLFIIIIVNLGTWVLSMIVEDWVATCLYSASPQTSHGAL